MSQGTTIDFSQYEQAAPAQIDFSKYEKSKSATQPGLLDREIPLDSYTHATESGLQSIGRGVRDAAKGTWDMITAPPKGAAEETANALGAGALPLFRTLRSLGHTAEDATQLVGAIHDINASDDPLGYYAKAAQETAGQGAGQALLALGTEGAIKAAPAVLDAAKAVPGKVVDAARVVRNVTPKQAAAIAGGTAGAVGGAHIPGFQTSGGVIGATVGAERGAALAERFLKARADAPIFPKKVAAPAAVATTAADDLEGVTSPQTEAAGELAEEAAPEAAPQNAAASRKIDTSPKVVQQQLEDALGGKKLVPGVSLKNQITAQGAAAGALPEGFTPVESSALKGYKYDPAAREFEYVTKDGSHYVRGDVDPEAAAQFEKTAADTGSFGKAWHELRNNPQGGVGQFKVLNGKRVPVVKTGPITDLAQQIKDSAEPSQAPAGNTLGNLPQAIKKSVKARSVVVDPATGRPEFSDVLEAKQPATGAPEQDLTAQLTKSVEQAKAKKAAAASTVEEIPDNVMTMRDPGELAKRWGVDAQSLAEGREQTRGMSPAETEAQIQQLTARYKKGFAVEPVMETRDAENNLIEVDGRARAIAAQRAGVKKVPIIVRRLAAK